MTRTPGVRGLDSYSAPELYWQLPGWPKLPGWQEEIVAEPLAISVSFTKDALRVEVADGREISVPIEWSPRLRKATPKQRKNWRLTGGGVGIHWEDVDEDISVESLLAVR